MEAEYGWIFKQPVDPVELNLPDYFDVVRDDIVGWEPWWAGPWGQALSIPFPLLCAQPSANKGSL